MKTTRNRCIQSYAANETAEGLPPYCCVTMLMRQLRPNKRARFKFRHSFKIGNIFDV